ncbi:MAG: AAA family ATPase [Desulfobacterales bacterium]|nr:MAG: AAA family ATPase [Desulfobacterales bacterium]
MQCPHCTHVNPPGVKFCSNCGQMMGAVCPGCNAVNLPESNFCNQCGQFLPKISTLLSADELSRPDLPAGGPSVIPPSAAGERKLVTALFSDLSGYTALAQRLDPEEVKEILTRLSRAITQVVTKYEGFIEKFIGDAVMALFGAVRAHEDDPIRAIRAAREIHELVSAFSADYERHIGQPLSMHTGINTGLVVTGDIDFDKGTHGIAGATLNVAARLCSLAPPGDILVGSETYRQALGYFNFDALEPLELKGISTPLPVYKVISRIDLPTKIHRFHGLRADLIGRNPELELLTDALDGVRAGKGCLVSICGNAGTGKSRLLEEFKSTLNADKINWREGQCYPYARNITYFPLIDLLNRTLRIEESDAPEAVRKKIESGLDFVEHPDDVVPYVGSLYNLQYLQLEGISPEIWRLRLQKAILEILIVMARRAPTIICLEDLHCADPSSLELIRFLLSDFRYPALVICVYRPTLTLLSPQQIANLGESYLEIRLEDLSPAETEAMVASLLKTAQIPLALKRFVREKAGGNPFYLEETINSLVESQILVSENACWRLNRAIAEAEISSTIHGVIAARIDRLDAEMKRILQEAAVIGRAFYYEILSHITAVPGSLWHHLSSLETLDLIKARSYKPAVEYIFKHALTQEVVYSGLVKGKRQAIHERVAQVMEKLFADRLPEYYEALAYHFQRGQSRDKAVDYLTRSGAKSLERYALEEAHQHYQDALAIISAQAGNRATTDRLVIETINQWSFVYYYRGRYKELLSLLTRHQARADALPDSNQRGLFYAWLGCALWHRERFKEAHQHLLTALALGEEKKDFTVVGYACCWLTWVCTELGLFKDAIDYAARAQRIFKAGRRDDYIYFSSMAGMGYAFWHQGNKSKTLEVGEALLDFGRRQGDYRARGMGYCCLGWSHLVGGDVSQATRFFEKAVQVSLDPWYSLFPKLALAYGLIVNGKVPAAQHYISEILEFSAEFGAEFAGKPAHFFEGMVLLNQGRINQGLQMLEESCQHWLQNGSRLRYAVCGSMLASVYADLAHKARGRHQPKLARLAGDKAHTYFHDTIEAARQIGTLARLGQAYRDWGFLYRQKGETDKADKCFDEAVTYFRICGLATLAEQIGVDSTTIIQKRQSKNE